MDSALGASLGFCLCPSISLGGLGNNYRGSPKRSGIVGEVGRAVSLGTFAGIASLDTQDTMLNTAHSLFKAASQAGLTYVVQDSAGETQYTGPSFRAAWSASKDCEMGWVRFLSPEGENRGAAQVVHLGLVTDPEETVADYTLDTWVADWMDANGQGLA